MITILDRLRDAVSIALEDDTVIAGGHDAALDVAMRAAARVALKAVKENIEAHIGRVCLDAVADYRAGQVFSLEYTVLCIDEMLAHLTEQEQTDGEATSVENHPKPHEPRDLGAVAGMRSRQVHHSEVALEELQPAHGQGDGRRAGESAQGNLPEVPPVALSPEVETLLKEAARFDSRTGPWISAAQSLVWRLANALRASETAKQQAEQELERETLRHLEASDDRDRATSRALTAERALALREAEIARQREQDYIAGWDWGRKTYGTSTTARAAFAAYLKAQTGSEIP